jgi:transposase
MAAPATNSEFDLLERRHTVAQLKLRGYSQVDIARQLNVSTATICTDVKAIKAMWREECVDTVEDMRNEAMLKLRKVEREAWSAWERSQSAKETKSLKSDGESEESQIREEGQVGDPRFLDIALKANREVVDLVGLAAPKKLELKDVSAIPIGGLVSGLLGLIEQAATDPAGEAPVGSDEAESAGSTGLRTALPGDGEAVVEEQATAGRIGEDTAGGDAPAAGEGLSQADESTVHVS